MLTTVISGLPVSCRPAIHAARLIYREIGEEVRRRAHDSVTGRAVVDWESALVGIMETMVGDGRIELRVRGEDGFERTATIDVGDDWQSGFYLVTLTAHGAEPGRDVAHAGFVADFPNA